MLYNKNIMMTVDMSTRILDIVATIITVVFIWLSISTKRTLVGSFFKKYYWLMIISFAMFGLGLLIEAIGDLVGLSVSMAGDIHHILLIVSVIIVIIAGFDLPKEAAKQLKLDKS